MKKLILLVTLILVACTTPATPVTKPTGTVVPKELVTEPQTPFPTEIPASTSVPPTPTENLVNQSTATSQPPATCPQIEKNVKLPLNLVFKDKKAPYHDSRDAVLKFLNQGGDPKTAIEKLAEFNIYASTLDLTNDGVPEFILPSGYLTFFGCQDGKYVNLLNLPPSERAMTAVPLAIQDINQNGLLELLIGQVQKPDLATYQVYEWDGTRFSTLLPADFKEVESNISIKDHIIYAVGQSNAEKGAFEKNWEIQTVGDGPKRIAIRAGVFDNLIAPSDLEQSLILKWNGDSYVVAKLLTEDTPTPLPTSTPLPFSATCSIKVPELRFQKPKDIRLDEAILDYLNAGGMPERLDNMKFGVTIKDLNNDTAPEIILHEYGSPAFFMFTCQNGKYQEATTRPIAASLMNIIAIKDNNKNGFPEVFIETIDCVAWRCGGLYVIEWDGENYTAQLVEYSNPEFRFQAVQDGDRYSEAGLYEKALQSYQKAITSDTLKWWTEDLYNYTIAPHGLGPCAENISACPLPVSDPNERPILSAYSSFRKMLVHLKLNDIVRAESTYQSIMVTHSEGTPGYRITELATLFWEEYQSSQNFEMACKKSITYFKENQDVLTILTGGYSSFYDQGINYEYEPEKVCPFR